MTPPGGSITDLQIFGTQSGLLPSNKELVFVENHDSERNASTLRYDDSVNLIAFSRGHQGWITINHEATAQTHTFATNLPRGRYCDNIHGNLVHGHCSGPTVAAQDAVVFDAADLVGS